jgi:hypothetical protein
MVVLPVELTRDERLDLRVVRQGENARAMTLAGNHQDVSIRATLTSTPATTTAALGIK